MEASSFREARSVWGDMLDAVGEMPTDGWRSVLVQGPIETPEGIVALVDVPVWNQHGDDMDWFLKFALIPGSGEEWRIDYVTLSN